jgi:hypothetical protein
VINPGDAGRRRGFYIRSGGATNKIQNPKSKYQNDKPKFRIFTNILDFDMRF